MDSKPTDPDNILLSDVEFEDTDTRPDLQHIYNTLTSISNVRIANLKMTVKVEFFLLSESITAVHWNAKLLPGSCCRINQPTPCTGFTERTVCCGFVYKSKHL